MKQQPFFSSQRERRLWALTLAVVVAIYSTLALASSLAGLLREKGLLVPSFVLGLLLIAACVLTQALTLRPSRLEVGVGLGVAASYLLVLVRMANPAERTHLLEYSVVAVLVLEALGERARQGRRVPVPALLAFGATASLGALDECLQALIPSRVFDPRDILFNVLAALMAVLACVLLRWARRWASRAARSAGDGS